MNVNLGQNTRARLAWNTNKVTVEGTLPTPEGTTSATTNFDVDNIYPHWAVSGI